MDSYITRAEHEEFRRLMDSENERLKEENDRQNHRIAILEKSVQQISNLAASTEKLATNMENMLKVQEQQGKRLQTLENQDGEKWRKAMAYIGLFSPRLDCKEAGEVRRKKGVRTMDVILAFIAVFLLAFIVTMIILYYLTGAIPDTLCTCVFAVCGGECGVMGWIKTTKERQRDRQYELEDRKHQEDLEKQNGNGSEETMPE